MKSLINLFLVLFIYSSAHSQKEGNIWTFGDSAAIDFNSGSPVPILGTAVVSRFNSSSICDKNGNLLFYSGPYSQVQPGWYYQRIWNKYNQVIINGDSIFGVNSTIQGSVLLPFPGDTNKYYLVTRHRQMPTPPDSYLYYTIIDKTLNSDSGSVIIKNMPLLLNNMAFVIGIRHGNGRDWWILSHESYTDAFYKFLLTPYGIYGPSIQNIGFPLSAGTGGYGQISLSPDGNKIITTGGNGIIDLFNFDRCTGVINNWVPLGYGPTSYDAKTGCSFSPNSNVLYVSDWDTALYQFDLLAPDIKASRQTIWTRPDSAVSRIGLHLLGPDGRIYIANLKPTWSPNNLFNLENMNLSVINNPDSLGLACNFQPYSFYLGGRRSFAGLPNIPDYNLREIPGSICDSLTVGIEEIDKLVISVYPNPASELIQINLPNNKISEVKIFDVFGKLIKQEVLNNKNEIDISELNPGIYFVKVTTDKQEFVSKFIKQ